jgi:hypothetical protein
VQKIGRRWVQEAAKAVEEIAAGVAENTEEESGETQADETTAGDSAGSAEAAAVAAEDTTEESAATTEDVAAGNASSGDSATLPFTGFYESLQNLDSYLAEYRISIESPDETATIFFQITETANPRAMHLLAESNGNGSGNERMEMYVVNRNGNNTVFMQNPDPGQGQPWIAMSGGSMDDAFGMLPISPATFGAMPSEGKRAGNEDVNDIPTTVYTISTDDYAAITPGVIEAEGKYWFSEEYQILVKAYQRVVGGGPALGDLGGQSSAYTLDYELKKLNDPSIVVTVPEEALASDPMSGSGNGTDQAQFPLPPNAKSI